MISVLNFRSMILLQCPFLRTSNDYVGVGTTGYIIMMKYCGRCVIYVSYMEKYMVFSIKHLLRFHSGQLPESEIREIFSMSWRSSEASIERAKLVCLIAGCCGGGLQAPPRGLRGGARETGEFFYDYRRLEIAFPHLLSNVLLQFEGLLCGWNQGGIEKKWSH
jgi:hypothetical protein